jgi:predicted nucleic acid-binding protein
MVLACALDDQAGEIVSGDRHLLDLGSYRPIPLLTVRQFAVCQFLALLEEDPGEKTSN